jgi:hypothetical protein
MLCECLREHTRPVKTAEQWRRDSAAMAHLPKVNGFSQAASWGRDGPFQPTCQSPCAQGLRLLGNRLGLETPESPLQASR